MEPPRIPRARRFGAWSGRSRVIVPVLVASALVIAALAYFQWGSTGQPAVPAARPSPTASPRPLTVAEIYQTLLPSVVYIKAGDGSGTGVVVNGDGFILTALHVVEGASTIEIAFADGTRTQASVMASDPANDIALLAPEELPQTLVPAVLGASARLNVGDDVVAIGNQLGLGDSTTAGVVSGLGRTAGRKNGADLKGLIQFDAAVNPGSSGGPLVNTRGEIVGIVVALANPTEAGTFIGIGFAVPIGTAVAAGGDRQPQI